MIVLHGAAWLNLKTEGMVQARARAIVPYAALVFGLLFAAAGLWVAQLDGYRIAGAMAHDGPSNPLGKSVVRLAGGWLANTSSHPALWLTVAAAYAGAFFAVILRRRPGLSFLSSALVPIGTIATAGTALFPFLLPSSSNPDASLTVWDASSSRLTLAVMLGAVALILPVVVAYTAWVYRVLRGPVRESDITENSHTAY